MDQLPSLITKARERRKLNKSQMAAKLGISSQLLGQYEQGIRTPKAAFFIKWKEVFGEDLMKQIEANVSRETVIGEKEAIYGIGKQETGQESPRSDKTDEYIQFLRDELKAARQELKDSNSSGTLARLNEIESMLSGFLVELKKTLVQQQHQINNLSETIRTHVTKATDSGQETGRLLYKKKGTGRKSSM